jgi:hypothetical protein
VSVIGGPNADQDLHASGLGSGNSLDQC